MSTRPGRAVTRVDVAALRAVRRALGGTPAVPLARGLSLVGEHAAGWLVIGAVGWSTGVRRRTWAEGSIAVLAAHGAGVVVKRVVRRPRPQLRDVPPLVRTPSRLSFPSAHSCSTAAAAVGFAPVVGVPVAGAVTSAMLVSRVLLGVHYPSDVLAGALLGGGVAAVVRRVGRTREAR